MKLLTMTLSLAAALGLPAWAMAAATLVQDVRVFDGQRMHAKRSVLINGATIANADFKGAAPAGARVVSGAGKTLLPGLIDAHVHAFQDLGLPLLFGVTTQVDMFTAVPLMQDVMRRMKDGSNAGQADMFSAGTLATAPGGHGTQFGIPVPTLTKPDQAQAFVDARLAEGSHFIKIVLEEGSPGRPLNSLDLATARALIEAAHLRSRLAVVHVSTLASAHAALEAGADGLVHLFTGERIEPAQLAALAKLAKARKAFVIPTFSVLASMAGIRADELLADAGLTALLTKAQRASLMAPYGKTPDPARLAAPKAVTLALFKAGVPILAGTDAGNGGTQYGISMHHEMAALVAAGLTPVQALAAATSVPATSFKLGQRGRIANGHKADLLLVEGDPGADIANTRRIVAVWKDGQDTGALREAQRAQVAAELSAKPVSALPPDGRISDFSAERLGSPFGFGWMPASDAMMGGKSSVKLQGRAKAEQEPAAVEVKATVAAGSMTPFAGIAFMPGAKPMQPVDLSAVKVIRFRVRGDGQQYLLHAMSAGASVPGSAPFTAESQWREVVVPLASLKGVDASMISMIAFNAGPTPGSYVFHIADVRLANE